MLKNFDSTCRNPMNWRHKSEVTFDSVWKSFEIKTRQELRHIKWCLEKVESNILVERTSIERSNSASYMSEDKYEHGCTLNFFNTVDKFSEMGVTILN